MNKWILLLLVWCYSGDSTASIPIELQKAYQQAKKSHRSKPLDTIALWHQYKDRISNLSPKVQYNWHQFTVISYIRTSKYNPAAAELGQLVNRNQANTPENIITLSNLAGVIFSHTGKYLQAQAAYRCALKQNPPKILIKARLIHNMALAQLNNHQHDQSIDNFLKALEIANQQNALDRVAFYGANIGYAYLQANQPQKALSYLRRSLFLKEQSKKAGNKVKTALHLLYNITLLQDWQLYDRYFANVKRMVKTTEELWIESYFIWIQAVAKSLRTGKKPNQDETAYLLEVISNVTSLQSLNNDYKNMAKILDIPLPNIEKIKQNLAVIDDKALISFINYYVNHSK